MNKQYHQQLRKSLKIIVRTEYELLEVMTNLMLLKELKKNNINFKDGDTFSFEDQIFDESTDKNVQRLAKLRRKMLSTLSKILEENDFKDKEIKFLSWKNIRKAFSLQPLPEYANVFSILCSFFQ